MTVKKTANRPSESNRQFVRNSHGELVPNVAYQGSVDRATTRTNNDFDSLKEEFSYEEFRQDNFEQTGRYAITVNGTPEQQNVLTPHDVFLEDFLDMEKFEEHLDNGLITARKHEKYPLTIYKYSARVCTPRHFDETLMNVRGLIVDEDERVVARGFNKFFGPGQLDHLGVDLSSNQNCTIMDKEDGSLGIIYPYDGKLHVATAGSFHSEQAEIATKILQQQNNYEFPEGVTPLVEFIHPNNRIIRDYEGAKKLVLIGGANHYGHWVSPELLAPYWDGEVVTTSSGTLRDVINAKDPKDTSEGFVARLDNGMLVKFKHPSYLELHKLKFDISRKRVLDCLKNGVLDEYRLAIPDEFIDEVEKYEKELKGSAMGILHRTKQAVEKIPEGFDRKESAIWITKNIPKPLQSVAFSVVLKKQDDETVLRGIYGRTDFRKGLLK